MFWGLNEVNKSGKRLEAYTDVNMVICESLGMRLNSLRKG